MSGLLEKDICLLLKGHRNTMILFLMICVFLGLSQTDTFILGYFPFLMIVLLIGTLSCDEADNCRSCSHSRLTGNCISAKNTCSAWPEP